MTKIITTDNGQQYQTAGFGRTAGAIYAGSVASGVVTGIAQLAGLPCMKNMQKLSQDCDTVQLRKAVNDTFGGGALPAKGVEIIEAVTPKESSNIQENLLKLFNKEAHSIRELHPENKKLVDALSNEMPGYVKRIPIFKDAYLDVMTSMFENGSNACYLPKGKKVVVNMEKLGLSAFHEMGHAINHNCSKFWKVMQGARGPMNIAGGLLAATALFKRKKVEGEEPKNVFDKATTFVKNNVGKLVTLSFVPMVAEELMATHRGNKMAAKVLPKDILKKVKMSNRLGAATYIMTAVATGAGAYFASKVRDKIAKSKMCS